MTVVDAPLRARPPKGMETATIAAGSDGAVEDVLGSEKTTQIEYRKALTALATGTAEVAAAVTAEEETRLESDSEEEERRPRPQKKMVTRPGLGRWEGTDAKGSGSLATSRPGSARPSSRRRGERPSSPYLGSSGGGGRRRGGGSRHRASRPSSAPGGMRGLRSANFWETNRGTTRLYNTRQKAARVTVHKNGELDGGVTVVAQTIGQLLDGATRRLGMANACRRAFDAEGHEIKTTAQVSDLHHDADVFVSTGAAFIEPFRAMAAERARATLRRSGGRSRPGTAPAGAGAATSPGGLSVSKRVNELAEGYRPRALVYENGRSGRGAQVVTEPTPQFLNSCTAKMGLPNRARKVYDLWGKEVRRVDALAVCAEPLWPVIGRVAGPLWTTYGEKMIPEGPQQFVHTHERALRARRKEYERQIADIRRLTSSAGGATNSAAFPVEDLEAQVASITASLDYLGDLREVVDANMDAYVPGVAGDTFDHIPELDDTHRLIGTQGLRLRVYLNGASEDDGPPTAVFFNVQLAERGLEHLPNSNELVLDKLLDACTRLVRIPSGQRGARLFMQGGEEVKSVHTLQRDDVLFLSAGEDYISTNVYTLALQLDGALVLPASGGSGGNSGTRIVQSVLTQDPETAAASAWTVVKGASELAPSGDTLHVDVVEGGAEYSFDDVFVERAADDELPAALHHPSLVHAPFKKGSILQGWALFRVPHAPQCAIIGSRAVPGLVLAYDSEGGGTGTAVGLAARKRGVPTAHMWLFKPDGTIRPAAFPELALTLCSAKDRKGGSSGNDSDSEAPLPAPFVLEHASNRDTGLGRRQRWGFKQAGFTSMGQWKLSREVNRSREWNKLALLWPVGITGAWNDEMAWPVEASALVASAPWIRRGVNNNVSKALVGTGEKPLRLRCVANGAISANAAASVVVHTLPKAPSARVRNPERWPLDTQRWFAKKFGADWRTVVTSSKKGDPLAHARRQQMATFLDNCTRQIPLSGAGRIVYTADGRRVNDLQDGLSDGDLCFVSMGEPWIALMTPELKQRMEAVELQQAMLDTLRRRLYPDAPLYLGAGHGGALLAITAADGSSDAPKWHQDGFALLCGDKCLTAAAAEAGATVSLAPRAEGQPLQSWVLDAPHVRLASEGLVLTVDATGGTEKFLLQPERDSRNAGQAWGFKARSGDFTIGAYAVTEPYAVYETVLAEAGAPELMRREVERCLESRSGLAGVLTALETLQSRFEERPTDRPIEAPTPSLETPLPFQARVFKNGVVNPRDAVTVVASIKVTESQLLLDMFIEDARNALALPNAGRCLYTRDGKEVTRLDTKALGKCPDLWLSQGEHFYPPGEHREVLLEERNAAKAEFKGLYPSFQADLKELRKLVARREKAGKGAEVTDEESELSASVKEKRGQLRELKAKIKDLDKRASTVFVPRGPKLVSEVAGERLCKTHYRTVRVRARRNGDDRMDPKLCVGRGMEDLLQCCTELLGMRRAKKIFTLEGKQVTDLEQLGKEQQVYVSNGEAFINIAQAREEKKLRSAFGKALGSGKSAVPENMKQ